MKFNMLWSNVYEAHDDRFDAMWNGLGGELSENVCETTKQNYIQFEIIFYSIYLFGFYRVCIC